MSVHVQTYSIQFIVTASGPQWTFTPSLENCEISVGRDQVAVLVFDLQTIQENQEQIPAARFESLSWRTSNLQQPSFVTVTFTPDSQVVALQDDNTVISTAGSYEFYFVVTYDSLLYTSPDPIIVNRDTGGNWQAREAAGTQAPIAAVRTMGR